MSLWNELVQGRFGQIADQARSLIASDLVARGEDPEGAGLFHTAAMDLMSAWKENNRPEEVQMVAVAW